jgi:uncharacterized membrane protein SpoIIM required for sporulation/ABC-type transport system involved in multi-copper enzyme maturation permease subunit
VTADVRGGLGFRQAVGLIAGREIADQLRDWRILTPIAILTLFFPLLMNFTANRATSFVAQYGANVVADRLIPFLLMVVGFFPISISLVIALESFAGERERLSLEPLLATPLTDGQLYLGKMLASLLVPLLAAYLGIGVYLLGLALTVHWTAPPALLAQILMLTTMQALVMVSGAVVISSQTTSVRAANLLASFIIVPMSQLIIGESLIMFWARYGVLWWIVFGLFVVAVILGRMGMHLFNREELLGREIDVLDFRWAWNYFRSSFRGGANGPLSWYAGLFKDSLPRLVPSLLFMVVALVGGYLLGVRMASQYQIPPDLLKVSVLRSDLLDQMRRFGLLSGRGLWLVLANNLRAIGIASIAGVFTFGVLGVILLMVPIALIGYFAGNLGLAGFNTLQYLLALVVPHGLVEIPAALLAGAAILRLGMSLVSPPLGESLGQSWLTALAEWCRVIVGIVVPLLVAAAAVEVFVTPLAAARLLGGG